MDKAELQKQSAEDVKAVQALMRENGIRLEARQQLNTNTGFIELVVVFLSMKRVEAEPAAPEEPTLVEATETTEEHAA